MPMVNSVVRPALFPDPDDLPKVRPGYEEAIAAELAAIFEVIPHRDLAIQWDCAWEVSSTHGVNKDYPAESNIATHTAPISRLSKKVPDDVALGFHFCFGTFGGWPRFSPDDLGRVVELANAAVVATGRRVDWVHIPTLDRSDAAFYAPLAKLDPKGARVYIGMIHSMASFDARLALTRQFLPDFGLAAYCGFGRTPPGEINQVLADHLDAVKRAGLATRAGVQAHA